MRAASDSRVASRRSRYSSVNSLICSRHGWVSRYRATAYWVSEGGQSTCASVASTSFSRTASGASTQPTRRPGENVLENEPR